MALVASMSTGDILRSPQPPVYTSIFDNFGNLGLVGSMSDSGLLAASPLLSSAPGTPLPIYDCLPSLEPWLAPLRDDAHFLGAAEPQNPTRASLALFEPAHAESWALHHAALVRALRAWGLPTDPNADIRGALWPESDAVRRTVRDVSSWLPEELRNTALWMTFDRPTAELVRKEGLEVSELLTAAIGRLAYANIRGAQCGIRRPRLPRQTLKQLVECLPRTLAVPLYHAGLGQMDYERMVRALFLLQTRSFFVKRTQELIAARSSSRVYRMISTVLSLPRGGPEKASERDAAE